MVLVICLLLYRSITCYGAEPRRACIFSRARAVDPAPHGIGERAGYSCFSRGRAGRRGKTPVASDRAAAIVAPPASKVEGHAIPGDVRPAGWRRAQLASLPQDVPGPDAITDACSTTLAKAWTAARS
eukprot:8818018-Pyramimonas_sp.AAC.1